MLVGFSISKCIRDILAKEVDPKDVLVIIGRTNFDLDYLDELIYQYQNYTGDWAGFDVEEIKELLTDLYHTAKIHQPRKFGVHPKSAPYGEHWVRLTPEPYHLSPAAKKAYDHYLLLAGLTS
jgi:hypothetical protein